MSVPPKIPPNSASTMSRLIALALAARKPTKPSAVAVAKIPSSPPFSVPSIVRPMSAYSPPSRPANEGFSAASLRIPLLRRRESASRG